MQPSTRVFWWSGAIGIGVASLLAQFGWLGWAPFVNDLVRRGGAAGAIATAVLGTTVWILLTLLAIGRRVGRERRVTRFAVLTTQQRAELVYNGAVRGLPTDDASLFARPELADSRVHRRYTVFRDRATRGDRDLVGFLLAARSAVDEARSERPYGPIRALVWALPALGFLGTAAEMSSSIGGVGAAVARTSSYGDLRDFLAQNVIPPLANAFGITLFALACSVLCHVLLSITYAREQGLAIDVDDWALDQMALRMPPSPAAQVISINGDIDRLAGEIALWRSMVSDEKVRSAEPSEEVIEEVIEVLERISEQVGGVREDLDREIVLRPVRSDRLVGR